MKPLTPLEDATLRYVLAHAGEGDGWLDLTRISSDTGRMLSDVRLAVARVQRRGLLEIDEAATNTKRWVRFLLPEVPQVARGPVPGSPAP
jgi:hypothetical protein